MLLQDQLIADLTARLDLLEASNRDLLRVQADFEEYRSRNNKVVGEKEL